MSADRGPSSGHGSPKSSRPSNRITCPSAIILTPESLRHLDSLPEAANEVEPHPACGLDNGHDGEHWAMVQAQDDGASVVLWWASWSVDDGAYRIEQAAGCPAMDGLGFECSLREGHVGGHGFI